MNSPSISSNNMKCIIPEISWHNRDPVLSVDIQPRRTKDDQKRGVYRLASGGTDSHVLVSAEWNGNICGKLKQYSFGFLHVDLVFNILGDGRSELGHCCRSNATPTGSQRGPMVAVRGVVGFGRWWECDFYLEAEKWRRNGKHSW